MDLNKLYRIARKYHGKLNKDVVHDLILKFGDDLPSEAYLMVCIRHAKPGKEKIQEAEDLPEEIISEYSPHILAQAIRNVSARYQLEVDTFLECCVNSTYLAFEKHSGISLPILRKICMFARTEIKNEYYRICETGVH